MKPNTKCIVCDMPLYREPAHLAKIRYATCSNAHRHEAARILGPSPATIEAFKKGRQKGHKRRLGHKHTEESRAKMKESHVKMWATKAGRAEKQARGEAHYKWKGGVTPLTIAIRVCSKSMKWYRTVKQAAGYTCQLCNVRGGRLETHHLRPFAYLLDWHSITTLEEAHACDELWDLSNGMCLCARCHAGIHGKKYKGAPVGLFVYPTMFLKETDYEWNP